MAERFFRLLSPFLCLTLSACGGDGGGEGGSGSQGYGSGGRQPVDPFDQRFQEIFAMDLSTDMPQSGRASYSGLTETELHRGASSVGHLRGEMEMSVDFAAASSRATEHQALSGRMHNFRGTIDGSEVVFSGELTTAAARDQGFDSRARVADQIIAPPGRLGSLVAHFAGDLATGTSGGPVHLEAAGNFRGPGGAAASGTLGGIWTDPAGVDPLTANGRFVVERD